MRTELDPSTICTVLSDAAQMGYEVVSLSGGEPLIYGGLQEVLSYAKSLGMHTTVTTNGTLLDAKRLGTLAEYVDLLAISLDGPPAIHNAMRASTTAFGRMHEGLDHIRGLGFKFGFIHTLTLQSWEHLLWIAEFAAQEGASLLQIHPLELTGRARTLMRDRFPGEEILGRVYLLTLALAAKYRDSMKIQFDVFNRDYVTEHPEQIFASNPDLGGIASGKPADLMGLIIVEADGSVVPTSYGFSRQYMLCNIRTQRLSEAWSSYRDTGYIAFRRLCQSVFKEITANSGFPLFNWYELIVERSHVAI